MKTFIAALDQSLKSSPAVLRNYNFDTSFLLAENIADGIHEMRLRIINSPVFTCEHIDTVILHEDSLKRGVVEILQAKGIQSYLKIDAGLEEDGRMKPFDLLRMMRQAKNYGCTGTKMRSVIRSSEMVNPVLDQQLSLAWEIQSNDLIPIIEPEILIDSKYKAEMESRLLFLLPMFMNHFPKMVLKVTLPEKTNLYKKLASAKHRIVALSGGHSLHHACKLLSENKNMSASFSRALMEGLDIRQSAEEFDEVLGRNISMISAVSDNTCSG